MGFTFAMVKLKFLFLRNTAVRIFRNNVKKVARGKLYYFQRYGLYGENRFCLETGFTTLSRKIQCVLIPMCTKFVSI